MIDLRTTDLDRYSRSVASAKKTTTRRETGFTIAELITVIAIVAVLSAVAIPTIRFASRRQKEMTLQYRLHRITDAIDQYGLMRSRGVIKEPPALKADIYPKHLEDLTKPIQLIDGKSLVLLRERDLVDPMTGKPDWRTSSSSDEPDSVSTNEDNVFDVHSSSTALSLDGRTRYSEW